MKRKIAILCAVLILAGAALVAVAADPGSQEDPVVSLSYLTEQIVPEIKAYIDERLGEGSGNSAAETADTFAVVNLTAGARVTLDASGELILRQGKATVVATEKGGLADVTAGYDLADGSELPANHLLIVPVNDGRGLSMRTDGIVMIKGTYVVE